MNREALLAKGTIIAFLLGLFLVSLGAGLFLFKNQNSASVQIISAGTNDTGSSEILVHIDGAVINPGVYKLPQDSRVKEAIEAAGGFAKDADMSKVNLAAKITDGQKVYIQSQNLKIKSQNNGGEAGASLLININAASESELDKLPGVGPATVQKIIASRPYSAPEDLLTKKAVSKSVYEKIKDLVTY